MADSQEQEPGPAAHTGTSFWILHVPLYTEQTVGISIKWFYLSISSFFSLQRRECLLCVPGSVWDGNGRAFPNGEPGCEHGFVRKDG